MKQNPGSNKPIVAHVKTPFLYLTETFIYGYLKGLRDYRNVVVTGRRENKKGFPWDDSIEKQDWPEPLRSLWWGMRHFVNKRRPDDPMLHKFYRTSLLWLRPDAVHAHFGLTGLAAAPIAHEMGVPALVSFYGADLGLYPRKLGANLYRDYGMFDAVSLCTAEGPHAAKLLKELGCPTEKIEVLPIGVDIEQIPFRERSGYPGEQTRILFCGRLIPKKGLDFGLRAFAGQAKKHDILLQVIGTGPMEKYCRNLAKELGIAKKVRFMGSVDHKVFIESCLSSHILLAPSREDTENGDTEGGAPTVLLEGQASGLPIVSTRHADIPYVVAEGESAILADEGNVESLAGALDSMLENRDQWPKMGRAGRDYMEKRHSIETACSRLGDLYRKIIST